MQGLTLPRLSAGDPEVAGDGGLDPLERGYADRAARSEIEAIWVLLVGMTAWITTDHAYYARAARDEGGP